MMSRRPATGRRPADGGSLPLGGSLHSKSRASPVLSIGLVIMGSLLVIGYVYRGSGLRNDIAPLSRLGAASCSLEVQNVLPFLKKSYGGGMRKVLHVGPDSCSVVSTLLKEDDAEAWGLEPYDLDDVDENCKSLVRKGMVRVADVKFALPYKTNSFSHVIVSDALDYLSPKYLNKTAPELARVAADGVVILTGYPGLQKAKTAEMSKFGRPAKFRNSSWWVKFFVQSKLKENESASKKFEQAAAKSSYKPTCQVFHLKASH